MGNSAPERVEELEPLWSGLTAETQAALAYAWFDASIRVDLAAMCKRGQFTTAEANLRALRRIDGPETFAAAKRCLEQLVREWPASEDNVTSFTAALSLLTHLGATEPQVKGACFMRTMNSRLVYGDDRLVETMRADLLAASEA
ncbi:MAG: hypothetical protein QM723_26090 [Myxococcaceae bacterium]